MVFSRALQTLQDIINGIIGGLPDFALAVMIFLLFYFVGKRTRILVAQLTDRRQKAKALGLILGRLAQSFVVVIGLLVSLTALFPSFRPGDLIQLLGIGSVAIGFAFRDVFQNFLAGILLLLTASFKIGDQITIQDFEGTVEDIQTRATTIITYDGRRIVIPNTDLFTQSVTVHTAFGKRRMECEVGVGYGEDIKHVKQILLDAVNSIEGVLSDPPAEALVVALAESTVNIRVYWWTAHPRHTNILHLQDKILTTLKYRLVESKIDLPMPTQHILLSTQESVLEQDGYDDRKLLAKNNS